MTIGFVPSYVLESGIGKKLAQLKGLESGWHYPTFLLNYLRNPGPLFLFDKIIIDKQAVEEALEYLETSRLPVIRRVKRAENITGFCPSVPSTEYEDRKFTNIVQLFQKKSKF